MLIKKIIKRISLFIVLCALAFLVIKGGCTPQDKVSPKSSEMGRDFRSLSLHPNAKEILFVECDKSLATRCGVFRYHFETKHLQRYDLPGGYVYHSASFSPKGTYIVMKRVPLWIENKERIRSAYEHAEIVIMKSDGSDLQILPLAPGPKRRPIMSNNEDKVAYWRYELRDPGSKTLGANFDLWEVDLEKGEDRLFAGLFQFFQVSQMQYMDTDKKILLGAYGPSSNLVEGSVSNYMTKYNDSQIYQFNRGQSNLSAPLFSKQVKGANIPTIDRLGNIYYEGSLPQLYIFKSKNSTSAASQKWSENEYFYNIRELIVAPQGDFLMVIYLLPGNEYVSNSKAIGRLDTLEGKWQRVSIPNLGTEVASY